MAILSERAIVLLFFLFSLTVHGSPKPDLFYSFCTENSNYVSNSTYQYNLNLLLTLLSSNATTLHGRKFHNMMAGQVQDMVYGIYLCRGDVTDAVCQNCVQTASQEILTKCPNRKEAISWYDQCMFRYSNRSIFSIMEEMPSVTGSNELEMEDPDRFDQIVNETMARLIEKATYNASERDMFETGEANFNASTMIYGLVQCTPDLSGNDCNRCLENIFSRIPNCCHGKQGARILGPSCNFRYEVYPFYGDLAAATPPAPSPLPHSGKKGNSSRLLVAIIVPVVGMLIISGFLYYCWLNRKMRKIRTGSKSDSTLIVYGEDSQNMDSLLFDLETLRAATNSFSDANKIGEGGFGAVYKGLLYDICTLRYSNRSILGTWELDPLLQQPNSENFWDVNRSTQLLTELLLRLQNQAASGGNLQKYAAGEQVDFETIYAAVQCSPDVPEQQCIDCLDEIFKVIPVHMKGKRGGKVLAPSCNFRFEIYSFYQPLPDAPSPSPTNFPPTFPPPPPTNATTGNGKGTNISRIILITVVPSVGLTFIVTLICFFQKRVHKEKVEIPFCRDDDEITSPESLQFNLGSIIAATSDFSNANWLGRGGFGDVYKGVLLDGKEIAVKRLSKKSDQGELEFKNEVLLLAKLQHRNLIRLLGFCLEGEERLLIYEFLPKSSLDHFIFDPINRAQLDWDTRYKIIEGIARGLLYLHEDSQFRIIHRDLKASNVLLDANMNPKISDFGMAKLFPMDQTHVEASRIAGTYGYMAPEYAYKGHVSVKSDVYSFGVLILEIVSGQKICFHKGEELEHLVSYAWRKWREENALDIVDPTLGANSRSGIMRCIQIALLCVQESVTNRPTMASIVSIFNSYSSPFPAPLRPGFFTRSTTQKLEHNSHINEVVHSERNSAQFSTNGDSISEIYPR